MKTEKAIRSQKDLEKKIRQLESEKLRLENCIITQGAEIYAVVTDPAPIIKKAARDLAADSNFRSDVFNIALSLAAKYIGRKVSGSSGARDATESLLDRIFGQKHDKEDGQEQEEGWLQKIAEFFRNKTKDQNDKKT